MHKSPPIVLLLLALSAGASAQEVQGVLTEKATASPAEPETKTFRGPPQEAKFRFSLYQRVKLTADIDDTDATVAVYRTGGAAEFGKFFGYIRLGAGVVAERNVYDLSGSEALDSNTPPFDDDPWNVLSLVRLKINALIPFGRSAWSAFVFAGIRFGFETETRLKDAISGTFGLAIGYKVDKTLTVQIGFGLVTRIEDSPFGFPLLGVRWTPNDWFRLETRGPGLEAGFKPVESVELTLGGRYDNRQYRLEDDREVLSEHILEDQEVVAEFGVSWTPADVFTIRGVIGVVAYQEFEIREANGDTLFRSRTDQAPFFQLELALQF